MNRLQYLADTSVFSRLTKREIAEAFTPRAAAGQIGVCLPVAFELGFSARNHDDHLAITDRLWAFPSVEITNSDHRRGLEVQHALARRGHHRAVSQVDALVAAAAEARDLTVLHYDSDFELVAEVTGQPHEWIVARGTAD